jgi:hypothetical protein
MIVMRRHLRTWNNSELLLAIRHMAREAEGRTPNTARIDALLDERSSLLSPTPGESPPSGPKIMGELRLLG